MSSTVAVPGFAGTTLVISMKVTRRARLRLWLGTRLMHLASWVIGCQCIISQDDGDAEIGVTPDGIPRALSVSKGRRGYRPDACDIGHNLTIRLDGVEQRDVIAYDIDAGKVTVYARNAGCNLRQVRMGEEAIGDFVAEHRKGVVTVEREAPTP